MRLSWRMVVWGLVPASLLAGSCTPTDKSVVQVDPGGSITSVVISPTTITIPQGTTIQFAYYARTVDGDSVVPPLDWVANGGALGADGVYTGTAAGTFSIAGLTHQAPHIGDTVTVVVTPLVVTDSVVISPSLITLLPADTTVYSAAAWRSDGSVLTQVVTWVAAGGTISPTGTYSAGDSLGTFRVDAVDVVSQQLLDTATVIISTVVPTLQSVVVTPATASVATGGTVQFTARGRYSDGSLLPIPVTWSATSGSMSSAGLYFAGQSAGTFTVLARHSASGLSGTALVTVTGGLASIDISPATVALNFGSSQQFTVFGRQTDGTIIGVAVNFSATGGTVTGGGFYTAGQTAGTYRVIAREDRAGIADTAIVTVQAPPARIIGLDLLPNSVSVLTNGIKQFSAQDLWSNGTTSNAANISYQATAGTITTGGVYTAPQTAGTYKVIGVSGTSGFRDTTVVVVSAPTTLTRINISPGTVTVGIGQVVPFVATGTLSNGTTANVSVTWSVSGGGVINSAGTFTAGSVTGQYRVFAQVAAGTLRDTADVFVSSTPPTASNEPAGYVPFAIHNFSEIPVFGRAVGGVLGSWYAYPQQNPNLTLAVDPNAPETPDTVINSRFPSGLAGGNGPVGTGGWDIVGCCSLGQKREVYFSMRIKIVGPDFENQAAGTKAGFIAVGRDNQGNNELFFWLDNGTGAQAVQQNFKILFKQQGIPQPDGQVTRNLQQNVNTQPRMTAGVWHRWEAVLVLNTMGSSNGVFKMWIDGTQTHSYSDVTYVTPSTPLGFNDFKWNPTWGGQGGAKTRSDNIQIDHVYISGLP